MDENPYQSPLTCGQPKRRRAKVQFVRENNPKATFIALAVFMLVRILFNLFR